MENNWASEHLQTIRTLMERSALYRRALAPIFTYVGALGIGAATTGWILKIESPSQFGLYWMAVAVVAVSGSFLLVRRQALGQGEKFWSPPTRRIAQAMVPALLIGFIAGCVMVKSSWGQSVVEYKSGPDGRTTFLIIIWTLLYGLALHSAGFFMPRGIRLFGWSFLLIGMAFISYGSTGSWYIIAPMALMGLIFGASHLACGIYLYFTERKNAA